MKYAYTIVALLSLSLYAQSTQLEYKVLHGHEARPYLRQVAELVINVLKEYPYEYAPEGGVEAEDVDCYYNSSDTLMIGVFHAEQLIGTIIGLPLEQFEDKPYNFYPQKSLAPVVSSCQGYFYVALLLIEKEYWRQGVGQKLMQMFENKVRESNHYTHLCALVLEHDYQKNPAPADYDFYYERCYQRYFKEKQWIKHEPLIAYVEGGEALMRFWSVPL